MLNNMYTERLEDTLFQLWGDESADDYSELIEILNSEENFNTFGEGILRIVKAKYQEVEMESLLDRIKVLCKKNHIELAEVGSINTLKNWIYKGIRPKKAELTRDALFALAFALDLSVIETSELFTKVYLDRTFDFRNIKEVVYYYCLKNHLDWETSKKLICKANDVEIQGDDETVFTKSLELEIKQMDDEEGLMDFVMKYKHNLSMKNKTAYKLLKELFEEANILAQEEAEEPINIEADGTSRFKGQNRKSNNFTYEVITNLKVNGEKGTCTLFKNARLPKEIRNRFPEAGTISKKDMTYEEIRKLMILLFSYIFWYKVQKVEEEIGFEDYIRELNHYLFQSGLPEMYYGNPYDWLYLYCALNERPLDTFRGVLSEVLYT